MGYIICIMLWTQLYGICYNVRDNKAPDFRILAYPEEYFVFPGPPH